MGRKKHFTGFEGNPKVNVGLWSGKVPAMAVQNPFEMEYWGDKNIFMALAGDGFNTKIGMGTPMYSRYSLTKR